MGKRKIRSYVDKKTGQAYFMHVGRYNEITREGAEKMRNDDGAWAEEFVEHLHKTFNRLRSDKPTRLD